MTDTEIKKENAAERVAFFVANRCFALVNSRLPLIRTLRLQGWRVIVCARTDSSAERLKKEGVILIPINFVRKLYSPWQDLTAYFCLQKLLRRYRPTLIHLFHFKPSLLGILAIPAGLNSRCVATVTGLGRLFQFNRLMRGLIRCGYWLIGRKAERIIFQNPDDLEYFVKTRLVAPRKTALILGAGVDLERFKPVDKPIHEPPRILMMARLLHAKGIGEFVEAAKIVRRHYPTTLFQLAGEWDLEHPDSLNPGWLKSVIHDKIIQFLGFLEKPQEVLPHAYVFVYPSVYGEGIPRILLEAAACGVPVITTAVPGCKEAVIADTTGFLIPSRNPRELANKILILLRDPSRRNAMGYYARQWMIEKFDIRNITAKQLEIYATLGVSDIQKSLLPAAMSL